MTRKECVDGMQRIVDENRNKILVRVHVGYLIHAVKYLKDQPEIVRCKDCKHWDKTTRKEGNDCILGPWEDAECERFRYLDTYGELGEDFRRTNGDWFCADGERKETQ